MHRPIAALLMCAAVHGALAFAPSASFPNPARTRCVTTLCTRLRAEQHVEQSKAAAPSKKNAVVSSFMAGAVASMLVFSPLQLGAIELPDGWAESTTDEGRTYYYNIKTKQSQFEAPAGAGESAKSKAKRISDQNNLNKIEKFDALPAVPVDKVSVYKTPTLEGGCGDEDYRVNSVECGTPAKNVVEDVAEKSLGTLSILGDQEAEKKKAVSSAQRDRMLQQAELEALKKTALFQKLDAKTKDPEAMEKRKKQIEEITARNDIGAQRAPWTPPDRDGDERVSKPGRRTLTDDAKQAKAAFKLPSLELGMPSLPNPFGGGAKGPSAAQVKAPAAAVADVDDADEEEEE